MLLSIGFTASLTAYSDFIHQDRKGDVMGKNFSKGIGMYFFAEILCLFLALTLSALGGTIWRIVSCICTMGIFVCLCINYAYNRAEMDRKISVPSSIGIRCFYGGAVTLIPLLLGIVLILAKAGVVPAGYYRWYKLLDAPFLQLCNLCSMDVTAAALSWGETIFLAMMNLLPFVTVWVTYTVVRKGVRLEEIQYRK